MSRARRLSKSGIFHLIVFLHIADVTEANDVENPEEKEALHSTTEVSTANEPNAKQCDAVEVETDKGPEDKEKNPEQADPEHSSLNLVALSRAEYPMTKITSPDNCFTVHDVIELKALQSMGGR